MPLPVTAMVAMVGLTACSGGTDVEEVTTDNELIPAEVGVIPIGDIAPIYVSQRSSYSSITEHHYNKSSIFLSALAFLIIRSK